MSNPSPGSPPASSTLANQTASADATSSGSVWKSVELWVAFGVLILTGIIAIVLVNRIDIVSELPEDAQTPLEYVVNEAVARFGVPVVALLFLSACATLVAHNGGNTRRHYEFASKIFAFASACFAFYAGVAALL